MLGGRKLPGSVMWNGTCRTLAHFELGTGHELGTCHVRVQVQHFYVCSPCCTLAVALVDACTFTTVPCRHCSAHQHSHPLQFKFCCNPAACIHISFCWGSQRSGIKPHDFLGCVTAVAAASTVTCGHSLGVPAVPAWHNQPGRYGYARP